MRAIHNFLEYLSFGLKENLLLQFYLEEGMSGDAENALIGNQFRKDLVALNSIEDLQDRIVFIHRLETAFLTYSRFVIGDIDEKEEHHELALHEGAAIHKRVRTANKKIRAFSAQLLLEFGHDNVELTAEKMMALEKQYLEAVIRPILETHTFKKEVEQNGLPFWNAWHSYVAETKQIWRKATLEENNSHMLAFWEFSKVSLGFIFRDVLFDGTVLGAAGCLYLFENTLLNPAQNWLRKLKGKL